MKKLNVERKFVSKIAAAVLGLIVWVIIINVEDANFSTRVNDIPVQLSGEIVLENNDLVVSNKGELGKASIRVRGKRSDVINSMDNIYATADVSKIAEPGEYNIKVSYDVSTNAVYITEQKTTSVKVTVEKIQRKEIDVIAVQSGSAEDSGKIVESAPVVKKAEVRGTANDLAKVKYAAVFVDIDGLLVDSETSGSIVAVDEQFKKLDFKNNVNLNVDEVTVINTVYNKLRTPVTFEIKGGYDKAYIVESASFSELDVGVAEGTEAANVTATVKYNESAGKEYTVSLVADRGVYIPREYKTVTVKVKEVPLESKTLTVPVKFEKNDGQTVEASGQIDITVSGAGEELSAGNVVLTADVREYEPGKHSIPLKVKFTKSSLKTAERPVIDVEIK